MKNKRYRINLSLTKEELELTKQLSITTKIKPTTLIKLLYKKSLEDLKNNELVNNFINKLKNKEYENIDNSLEEIELYYLNNLIETVNLINTINDYKNLIRSPELVSIEQNKLNDNTENISTINYKKEQIERINKYIWDEKDKMQNKFM